MVLIIHILYPLHGRGKWQEFQNALGRLRFKYKLYSEIQYFLLIEAGVRLTYQKHRKTSKDLITCIDKFISRNNLNYRDN